MGHGLVERIDCVLDGMEREFPSFNVLGPIIGIKGAVLTGRWVYQGKPSRFEIRLDDGTIFPVKVTLFSQCGHRKKNERSVRTKLTFPEGKVEEVKEVWDNIFVRSALRDQRRAAGLPPTALLSQVAKDGIGGRYAR